MTREEAHKRFRAIDKEIKWCDFNLEYQRLLEDIFDEFESRTCKECYYASSNKERQHLFDCCIGIRERPSKPNQGFLGCNRFSSK